VDTKESPGRQREEAGSVSGAEEVEAAPAFSANGREVFREQKRLRTCLGCIIRDVERKMEVCEIKKRAG